MAPDEEEEFRKALSEFNKGFEKFKVRLFNLALLLLIVIVVLIVLAVKYGVFD